MSCPAGRDSLAFPPVSLLKASALVPGQKPSPSTCSDQEARSLLCVLVPRCHRLYVRQCFKENLILCLLRKKNNPTLNSFLLVFYDAHQRPENMYVFFAGSWHQKFKSCLDGRALRWWEKEWKTGNTTWESWRGFLDHFKLCLSGFYW